MSNRYWLNKMANLAKQYNARGLAAKRTLEQMGKLRQDGSGGKTENKEKTIPNSG